MTDTVTEKKTRNVVRDAACPKCGKLFYKHALRMHEPWCKTDKAGASTAPEGARAPSRSARRVPTPAAAAPVAPAPAKSDYWL
jgi:hypothetical protein